MGEYKYLPQLPQLRLLGERKSCSSKRVRHYVENNNRNNRGEIQTAKRWDEGTEQVQVGIRDGT